MLIFSRHADIRCNVINNLDNIINMKNITQALIRWAASCRSFKCFELSFANWKRKASGSAVSGSSSVYTLWF